MPGSAVPSTLTTPSGADAVQRLGHRARRCARPPWRRSWRRAARCSSPSTGRGDPRELRDDELDGLLDPAPQHHRVGALVEHAHALAHERLGQQRRRRRPVAGQLARLVGDLAHELRAHVLELVASSISRAIETPSLVIIGTPVSRSRTTLRPLGPSVTLTVSAQLVDPRLQQAPGVVVEAQDLAHAGCSPSQAAGTRMPRPWSRPWSRSAIASLIASSGYVVVCSVTWPCAVSVIRSWRST